MIQDERFVCAGLLRYAAASALPDPDLPGSIVLRKFGASGPGSSEVVDFAQGLLHVVVATIQSDGKVQGRLMLVHDMSFVHQRSTDIVVHLLFVRRPCGVISAVTVIVAQLSWRDGWPASETC